MEKSGVARARAGTIPTLALAVMAGACIAIGSVMATTIAAGSTLGAGGREHRVRCARSAASRPRGWARTRRLPLDGVNNAFRAMDEGAAARTLPVFRQPPSGAVVRLRPPRRRGSARS